MQLSCHCGLIQIEVSSVPVQLTSCNCSVCSRYAALWGYYGPAEVNVSDDKLSGRSYLWGDECVEFFHCQECGCITHYLTNKKKWMRGRLGSTSVWLSLTGSKICR